MDLQTKVKNGRYYDSMQSIKALTQMADSPDEKRILKAALQVVMRAKKYWLEGK